MEVMNENFNRNHHALERTRPRAVVLDWEEDELPVEVRGRIDLIMSVSDNSFIPSIHPFVHIRSSPPVPPFSRFKEDSLLPL